MIVLSPRRVRVRVCVRVHIRVQVQVTIPGVQSWLEDDTCCAGRQEDDACSTDLAGGWYLGHWVGRRRIPVVLCGWEDDGSAVLAGGWNLQCFVHERMIFQCWVGRGMIPEVLCRLQCLVSARTTAAVHGWVLSVLIPALMSWWKKDICRALLLGGWYPQCWVGRSMIPVVHFWATMIPGVLSWQEDDHSAELAEGWYLQCSVGGKIQSLVQCWREDDTPSAVLAGR
jgi:hypothetical protein